MLILGDFPVNSTIRFMWDTYDQTGASIAPSVAGTINFYKDSSTTKRSSLAGITDTRAFNTLVGVHQCVIDTSNNTDPGFWAAGSVIFAILEAATIDTKVVNKVLARFSIEKFPPFTAIPASPTADSINERIAALDVLNVSGVNTLAGHDPGATLVKVADLPAAGPDEATIAAEVLAEMNSTPPDVNVASETDHDFTATQIASLNAATPAVTVSDKTGFSLATPPPTTAEIADKYLGRNIAGGSDGGHTVRDALRALRNKVIIDPIAKTVTVYDEAGINPVWVGNLTVSAGAQPVVTEVDPTV